MKFLVCLLLFIFYCLCFALPVYAQSPWAGRCVDAANPDIPTIQGFECLFFNVLQVISLIAGLVFLVMFILGAFNFLFSGSDPKKVAAAGSRLTMAIMGLIGIIASYLILRLIENFTGVKVTDFIIPGP